MGRKYNLTVDDKLLHISLHTAITQTMTRLNDGHIKLICKVY